MGILIPQRLGDGTGIAGPRSSRPGHADASAVEPVLALALAWMEDGEWPLNNSEGRELMGRSREGSRRYFEMVNRCSKRDELGSREPSIGELAWPEAAAWLSD